MYKCHVATLATAHGGHLMGVGPVLTLCLCQSGMWLTRLGGKHLGLLNHLAVSGLGFLPLPPECSDSYS